MPLAADSSRAVSATGASSTAATAMVFCSGNTSHVNCSSTGYASAFSTVRQLSIAPVGHGGTHAMQPLQTSAFTT